MAITKIEGHPIKMGELGIKRCYLPITIYATCPECGEEVSTYLGDCYLSYPTVGNPTKVYFSHECEDDVDDDEYWCHEWAEYVVMDITIRKAKKKEL